MDAGSSQRRMSGVQSAFALATMRERAKLAGGDFENEPSASGGTTIYVRIPLAARTSPVVEVLFSRSSRAGTDPNQTKNIWGSYTISAPVALGQAVTR